MDILKMAFQRLAWTRMAIPTLFCPSLALHRPLLRFHHPQHHHHLLLMLQHPLCSQRHLLQSPQYPCQRLLHQPLALSLHPLPGTGTVLVEHVDAHTYPAGLERTPTQPIAILTQCSGKYIIGMMVHAPSQREWSPRALHIHSLEVLHLHNNAYRTHSSCPSFLSAPQLATCTGPPSTVRPPSAAFYGMEIQTRATGLERDVASATRSLALATPGPIKALLPRLS